MSLSCIALVAGSPVGRLARVLLHLGLHPGLQVLQLTHPACTRLSGSKAASLVSAIHLYCQPEAQALQTLSPACTSCILVLLRRFAAVTFISCAADKHRSEFCTS